MFVYMLSEIQMAMYWSKGKISINKPITLLIVGVGPHDSSQNHSSLSIYIWMGELHPLILILKSFILFLIIINSRLVCVYVYFYDFIMIEALVKSSNNCLSFSLWGCKILYHMYVYKKLPLYNNFLLNKISN